MNVLDSHGHVEALAFDYLTFCSVTILNNFWTCLALLTAALSFWKIRSSASLKPDYPLIARSDPLEETVLPDSVTEAETVTMLLRETVVANGGVDDVDGVRKVKFTVYYEEDAQCTCAESEELLTETEWEERDGCETEWWKTWEKVLNIRNGVNENGWYTCQDLTELNGNVVKFWDGGPSCIRVS